MTALKRVALTEECNYHENVRMILRIHVRAGCEGLDCDRTEPYSFSNDFQQGDRKDHR